MYHPLLFNILLPYSDSYNLITSLLSLTHQRLQVEGLEDLVLQRLWFRVNQGVLKKVGTVSESGCNLSKN